MKLGNRTVAWILTGVLMFTSVQFPAEYVYAEEAEVGTEDVADEAGDVIEESKDAGDEQGNTIDELDTVTDETDDMQSENESESSTEIVETQEEEMTAIALNGEIASGNCGENLTWVLDDEGVLTISGEGAMEDPENPEVDPEQPGGDPENPGEDPDKEEQSYAPWSSCGDMIRSVVIQDGVRSIMSTAFMNCWNLTSVDIPESVESIGHSAFMNCGMLTSINIQNPKCMDNIRKRTFMGCKMLEHIEFPLYVNNIEREAFMDCTSLRSLGNLEGVEQIGDFAFNGCESLRNVTIQGGMIQIGEGAFERCSNLENVIIDAGSVSIEQNVFGMCSKLTNIVIPSDIINIGQFAFNECGGLTNVYYFGAEEQWKLSNILTDGNAPLFNAQIHYDFIMPELPKAPEGFQLTSGILSNILSWKESGEAEVTCYKIYRSSFADSGYTLWETISSKSTTSYTDRYVIPGEEYFYIMTACGFLGMESDPTEPVSGIIEATETNLGGNIAVGSCGENAKWMLDGKGVLTIGDYGTMSYELDAPWYSYRENIKSVVIVDGVTNIERYAFSDCRNLVNVEIPSSVTSIGDNAFDNCSSLTRVEIPSSVTSIGDSAFRSCSSLENAIVLADISSIESSVFASCSELTNIVIPKSVTDIGYQAFYQCSKLTHVYYLGSEEKWEKINVHQYGNDLFSAAQIHYNFIMPDLQMKGLQLTSGTLSNILSWEESKEEVTSYKIYRSSSADSGYTLWETISYKSTTSYTDRYVTTGEEYFYTMTAVGFLGMESEPAGPVSGIIGTTEDIPGGNIASGSCGENVKWVLDGKGVLTIGDHGTMSYESDAPWYSYRENIKSVVIVDGVTNIERCAFSDCRNLVSVEIPSSVTSIGDSAFRSCSSLVSIEIPSGVTKMGNTVFTYCNSLENLIILAKIEAINPNDFLGCNALKNIVIPAEVTFIQANSFSSNYQLENIYYLGSEAEWKNIEIQESGNSFFLKAKIHYNFTMPAPPQKPVDLQLVHEIPSNILSWKKSGGVEVKSYKIYRSLTADGDYTLLTTISSGTTTSYTDKDVTAGEEYFYKITAVGIFGKESEPAGPISGISKSEMEPPVITSVSPKNGSVISSKAEFRITATDNTGLRSISLEFSTDEKVWKDKTTKNTEGTAVFYVNTEAYDAEILYVRITCEDVCGNIGKGATIYQYMLDKTPPEKVSGLWAESSSTTVTLHWDDVKAQDFSYFLVERRESDGAWSFCRKVSNAKGVNLTGMTPDTEYTFRVCAYDLRDNRGEASDPVTVSTAKDTTSPVVTEILPKPGTYNRQIFLRFSVSDDYGVSKLTVETSRDGKNWEETETMTVSKTETSITVPYTLSLADISEGLLYVRAVAEDFAGNKSLSGSDAPFTQYLVDKTPPAAPEGLHADGNDGFISLSWTQGQEADLAGYAVFRASAAEGPYTELVNNLRKVGYIDRKVTAGTTYYYKIRVADKAGNISGYSDTISAEPGDDKTAPRIVSISPSDGYVLGADTPIKVKVWDNTSVDVLCVTYTTDTESEGLDIPVRSADSVVTLPLVPGELHSAALQVSVYCRDASGNESGMTVRNYQIDTVAPAAPVLSAAAGDYCINLSWTSGRESDLAGFRIYRAYALDGKYQLIGQRAASADTYTDSGLNPSINYYYYVEAVDENGNKAAGEKIGPFVPLKNDTVAPVAVISGVLSGTVGDKLRFDGSASSDNIGIVSYAWDFGDGTQGTGISAAHTYSKVGDYTVQLTVSDAAGNSASATRAIEIKKYEAMGSVSVTAIDENGTPVPNAGIYFNLGTENMQVVSTDNKGNVVLKTAPGTYTIGGYCDGYLPAKAKAEVTAETTRNIILTLVKKDIIAGDIQVERMTLEDIKAAGIDVGDPANQEVYVFTIQLQYGTYADTIKVISNSRGSILSDPVKTTIRETSGVTGSTVKRNVVITAVSNPVVNTESGQASVPTVAILDFPGTAHWLKDFFDVRLTIINQADPDFVLDSCMAELEVPDGLTLLDTNRTSASSRVSMLPISGQSSRTAEWILRGDVAGEYNLTANFKAILRDFGVEVGAEFKTDEPFRVRKGDNLTLEVIAENEIVAGTDGAIRVGLRNDDSEPYYMPSLDLSEMAELRTTFKRNGFLNADTSLDTLYPGETIYYDYVVPRKNWETLTTYAGEDFFLMNKMVSSLGGTELNTEISEVMPFTIAADKIEVSMVQEEVCKPIKYLGINKTKLTKASVPDLRVTTYRMNENGEYVPCSMAVEIQDEYLKKNKGKEFYTVTTGEDGTYTVPGYEINTSLTDMKSYKIGFVTGRAKPFSLPVNIYGKLDVTGNLKVQVYEADGGSYTALSDVSVKISENDPKKTGKNGQVSLKNIYPGPHTLNLEKEGYIPISDVVTVTAESTNELYFIMQKDADPGASIITYVKNSLSDYTAGNQTIIPQEQTDIENVTFSLSKRIADGERFVSYLYRITNKDKKVKDSGEFSTDDGFYIDIRKMKEGDGISFALVTEKNGAKCISPYVDSYLTIAPPLNNFNEICAKLKDIKDNVKSSYKLANWEWKGDKEETEYIQCFPEYSIKDEDGKRIFTKLNGIYTEQNTSQWKLPIDLSYDLSGKFTFSVKLEDTMSGKGEYEDYQYFFHQLGMFTWGTKGTDTLHKKDKSNGVEFDFVARFDKKRNKWIWSLDGKVKGSQKFEIPIMDPVVVGIYIDLALSASESATWRLLDKEENWIDSSERWLPDGIWPKEAKIEGEIKASAGIEAVKKGLFKTGVWVKAGLKVFLPPDPKMVVNANLGYEATVLYLFSKEGTIFKNTWEISKKTGDAVSLEKLAKNISGGLTYALIDTPPSQLYQINARSLDNTLADNVLLETEPLLATMPDGTVLMVYAGSTGDALAPSTLYYTVHDGTGWSEPKVVDPDGTADIYPSLTATPGGAILAWNNFDGGLPGELSGLDEKAVEEKIIPGLGICAAVYDYETRSWGSPVDISVDQGVHLKPSAVMTADQEMLVAWVSNSGGSLTATKEHPDEILWVLLDADNQTTAKGSLPIDGIAAGGIKMFCREKNPCMAVLVENEAEESSLYYSMFGSKDWNALEKVNNWTGNDTAVCVLDDGTVYYENNGKIYSYDGSFSTLVYTCDEGSREVFGVSAARLSTGTVVSWISTEDGEAVIYAGVLNALGKITTPVKVYHTNEGLITSVSAMQSGENVSVLYRMNTASDSGWERTIKTISVPAGIDVSVVDGLVEHSGYLYPGADITTYVQAVDLGLTSAEGIRLTVSKDQSGLEVIESVQTERGNTATLQWKVPEDYAGETYYLSVSPVNGTDVNMSNNVVSLTNSLFDLSAVSAEYIGVADGAEVFSVTVENQGLVNSEDAAIKVEDLHTDTVLKTHPVGIVHAGESIDVQVAVEAESLEGHMLKFTVEYQDNELGEENNSAYAFVEHQEAQSEEEENLPTADLSVNPDGGLFGTLTIPAGDITVSEGLTYLAACYNTDGKMLGSEKIQVQADVESKKITAALTGVIQTGGQSGLTLKMFVLNDKLMPQCPETVFETVLKQ